MEQWKHGKDNESKLLKLTLKTDEYDLSCSWIGGNFFYSVEGNLEEVKLKIDIKILGLQSTFTQMKSKG